MDNHNTTTQCRICLESDQANKIPLNSRWNEKLLAECLRLVTGLQIHPDDNYPQFICMVCKEDLVLSWRFREKAVRSDRILRGSDITDLMKLEADELIDEKIFATEIVEPLVSKLEPLTDYEPAHMEIQPESDAETDIILGTITSGNTTSRRDTNNDLVTSFKLELVEQKDKKINQKPRRSLKVESLKKCCMCGKSFQRHNQLVAHVDRCHPEGNIPMNIRYTVNHKFVCPLCGRRFWQKRFLCAHFEDLNFEEPLIGKVKLARRLKREALNGKERFICTFCGKDFSSKMLLAMHEGRRHLTDRPHKCEECGKAFAIPRLLKRHQQENHGNTIYT